MKHLISLSAVAVVIASFVSCQKDMSFEDVKNVYEPVTLNVGVGDTKVVSEGTTIKWLTSAENILVLGTFGVEPRNYKFSKTADQGTTPLYAQFTSTEVDPGATLEYALFPYSDTAYTRSGSNFNLYCYSDQYAAKSGSVPVNTPLVGKVDGEGNVTMKSPAAFIEVTLPKTLKKATASFYSCVRIEAEGIAGKYTATVDGDGNFTVTSKGTRNYVKMTPKSNNSGSVYIPILPGTYDANSMTVKVEYNDGRDAFSKIKTKAQTFESNTVYHIGTFAGPNVEDASTDTCSISGTTLTVNGSANIWKYSGVTASDYVFKFKYKESNASEWSDLAASSTTEDGNSVSFSASVTIDPSKSYDCKAVITALGKDWEGDVISTGGKKTVDVELRFTDDKEFAKWTWTYDTPTDAEDGYAVYLGSGSTCPSGSAVFPRFPNSNKDNYWLKRWNKTDKKWADPFKTSKSDTGAPQKIFGGTLSRIVDGVTYSVVIPKTENYYTIYSSKLVPSKNDLKVVCPTGGKIASIVMYFPCSASSSSSATYTFSVGSTQNGTDYMTSTNITSELKGGSEVTRSCNPNAASDVWVNSLSTQDRLAAIVVTYEFEE